MALVREAMTSALWASLGVITSAFIVSLVVFNLLFLVSMAKLVNFYQKSKFFGRFLRLFSLFIVVFNQKLLCLQLNTL